jgi:3-hydroxybutyryl-CoA dehydrogenase
MTSAVERTIDRIGIVGCGTMGSGIAELCARTDLDVLVVVSSPVSGQAGLRRITQVLDRGVRKGSVTEAEREKALRRISVTTDLRELADRQLVVESVRECLEDKIDLFRQLDKVVEADDAILASNTSSIPITRLARVTGRPERVLGAHFFNPVAVLPLVELIGSELTAPTALTTAERFLADVLGRQVIRTPDRAGFVVNALLIPYLLAAIRMVDTGLVSVETVDQGMVQGCSHPLGPLRLADLIGLDTVAAIASALYEEFKEPLYAPPPRLLRMVEGRLYGRKSGRGFYLYP